MKNLSLDSLLCECNIALINIARLTPEKWENLKKYAETKHEIHAYILTETQYGGTDTPDYIAKDGYTLFNTPGPKQKGQRNHYNGGIALLVKSDTFDVTSKILLQNRHQITMWKLTAPDLCHPLHITGAYCSPASGKPPIVGLQWELRNRKPNNGIEIHNNHSLNALLQSQLELNQQQLSNCQLGPLTVKHFVKIGTKIYSPSLADPLEKQDIFDQTKEFYKILENTHINSPDEIHIVTLMDILDDVK